MGRATQPSPPQRPAANPGQQRVFCAPTGRPLQSWISYEPPEGRLIFLTTVSSGPSSSRR